MRRYIVYFPGTGGSQGRADLCRECADKVGRDIGDDMLVHVAQQQTTGCEPFDHYYDR